jgi:hypothetical protein
MRKSVHHWMKATVLLLSLPALAVSQETPAMPAQQGDTIPMLQLARDPGIDHGQLAAVQGTVGPEGLRFRVGELSILQPVTVMLLARDEVDDLTLSLFKKDWSNVRRTASTRGNGIARFEFRTQGGFHILLRGASTEAPFALVVWAGEELRPSMPDVVVTYDEFRKGNPAASSTLRDGRPGADGSSRGTSAALWITLAASGGGAGAFFLMRALNRRKQA